MGPGKDRIPERLSLLGLVPRGRPLGQGETDSKWDCDIRGRVGERPCRRVGVRKEHAFHGQRRRSHLQLGLLLRQPPLRQITRHRDSLP